MAHYAVGTLLSDVVWEALTERLLSGAHHDSDAARNKQIDVVVRFALPVELVPERHTLLNEIHFVLFDDAAASHAQLGAKAHEKINFLFFLLLSVFVD